mgnify:CR=1 FL=1
MKAIKQADTRNILDSYNREDISYSRMNEMFNELSDDWAVSFVKWLDTKDFDGKTYKELLKIYKKE